MDFSWNGARHLLGLYLILVVPGMLAFWLPVHGFSVLWKRIGMAWAYLAGFSLYVLLATAAWINKDWLLSEDYGFELVPTVLGIILTISGIWLRRSWARQLPMQALLGLAEVSPERHGTRLITAGAYERVRHPRYLEVMISTLGQALICHHLAGYAVCVYLCLFMPVVIALEESELKRRYGQAYRDYQDRVPALIPRRSAN